MQSYSMSFVGDTFAVCGAILVIFTFPGLEQFEQVVVGTIELQQQNLEQVQLFLELANFSSFFHSIVLVGLDDFVIVECTGIVGQWTGMGLILVLVTEPGKLWQAHSGPQTPEES